MVPANKLRIAVQAIGDEIHDVFLGCLVHKGPCRIRLRRVASSLSELPFRRAGRVCTHPQMRFGLCLTRVEMPVLLPFTYQFFFIFTKPYEGGHTVIYENFDHRKCLYFTGVETDDDVGRLNCVSRLTTLEVLHMEDVCLNYSQLHLEALPRLE